MAKYDYRCKRCGVEFEDEHPMAEHPKEVFCICGGAGHQLIRSVKAIIPYHMKSVKPYTPELSDVRRETEHVCAVKGWNPNEFLDDTVK